MCLSVCLSVCVCVCYRKSSETASSHTTILCMRAAQQPLMCTWGFVSRFIVCFGRYWSSPNLTTLFTIQSQYHVYCSFVESTLWLQYQSFSTAHSKRINDRRNALPAGSGNSLNTVASCLEHIFAGLTYMLQMSSKDFTHLYFVYNAVMEIFIYYVLQKVLDNSTGIYESHCTYIRG